MSDDLASLHARMDAAAKALDFEEARRLRDQISLLRGGASSADASAADLSGMVRQQPGAMGLGTNHPRTAPPAGWKPPAKPDLHTNTKSRRRPRGN